MSACKEHFLNPVRGYSACPGCEIERLRVELDGLRTGFEAQNEVIAGLKAENARSTEREILQLAEIEALIYDLKVAHSVINSVHPDQERMDWIEENYTGHGGGSGFNLRLCIPCDFETGRLRHGIDTATGRGVQA